MKNETEKTVMRGELALLMVVVLNSLGVLLMLHSGWDFGDFRCSVCISEGDAVAYAWNVDVYFPGTARLYADAYAEKIRPHLPVQFCGRLCVWRTDGSSRALDYTSSGKSAAAHCSILC